MILREYQQRAVSQLRQAYASGKRAPILVLPTGGGKTIVAAEIIRLALTRRTRTLFAVPRIELLNQAVAKLALAGCTNVRTIQAQNDNGSPDAPVTVASIPTLTTERWMQSPVQADLVIVDEAHHCKARTHEQFLALYQSAKLLGLSATPQRGDGRAVGDVFDALIVGATVRELIDLDALVPARIYAPPRIMGPREIAQDPVEAYLERLRGEKAIVFASTVAQAQQLAERFQQASVSARWLSGESRDREEILDAYARHEFRVLVNVSVLVEGFDDPSIQSAILARRFTHVGSYLQAIGRILRPSHGKTQATVVDLCGSALVHGTPDMEREYTLDGKGIGKSKQPIRQCQQCGGVFTTQPACPFCGHVAPPLTRAQARALGIQLDEITAATPKTSWPMRAKRPGLCVSCHGLIERGAWIVYSAAAKQAMHTGCAARARRAA